MRSWPSWLAIVLGALFVAFGLLHAFRTPATGGAAVMMGESFGWLLVTGAILLGAGLHSLQASYDSWCDCASCMGGCACCGDGCACGDCGECGGKGDAAQHSH